MLRDFGLRGELFQLVFQFALNVVDAVQIVARVFQARLGFFTTFLVFGHAGGFFQIAAQLFGLGFDQPCDHALLDNRVGACADAGAQK